MQTHYRLRMRRDFLRWIALVLLAAAGACSRAPEESDVSVSGEKEKAKATKPATIQVPSELPVRSDDDEPTRNGVATGEPSEEAKPASPENIKGRQQAMAEDILAMPEGEAQALALAELARRWAEADLEGAMAFRNRIDSKYGKHSDVRRAYYRGIATEMAKAEPGALLDVIADGLWWDGQWKPEREALNRVEVEDFDHAVNHFLGTMEGKQFKEESFRYARRIATERSVAEALTFAEAMKSPLAKGHALRGAVFEWAAQDVDAATRYIDGIKDKHLRSHAIDGLVGEIRKTNPEESIAWTLSMGDAELRSETFGKLAGFWSKGEHRAHLESLLQNGRLSRSDRAAIEARLSGN